MIKRRPRFTPALSEMMESLESRTLLSATASSLGAGHALHPSAQVGAATNVKQGATKTTLEVSTGALFQPITLSVTVRAAAGAGSPLGSVNITDHGALLGTLTLSPSTSTSARYAYSTASVTLTPQPGGSAYFIGKHTLKAEFVPSGSFGKSNASKTFAVTKPAYTTLAGGVKIATVSPGSGAQIQTGQTASVLYTGFLEKTGTIFDDSINDGGTPLSVTLGAGQVIPGFDEGIVGMQAGETRVILIPPAEGYGRTANGPIPGNSTLIFVVTLESIS